MILKIRQLPKLRKQHTKQRIVLAGGVFDLIHNGHLFFLEKLRKHGDLVVIAVSCDQRVRERKGADRPVMTEQERLEMVDAIKHVDYVVLAPKSNKNLGYPTMKIVEKLKPDVFITTDKNWLGHQKDLTKFKTKFKLVSRSTNNISTTNIINRILKK